VPTWHLIQLVAEGDDYEVIRLNAITVNPHNSNQLLASTAGGGLRELTFAPKLSLTMASSAVTVRANSKVSFSAVARNAGVLDASNVRIEVELSAAAANLVITTSGGNCVVAGRLATCTYGRLPINSEATVALEVTAESPGTISATARIVADQPYSVSGSSEVTQRVASVAPPADSGGGGGGIAAMLLIFLTALGVGRELGAVERQRLV
jgi:hypothetical protein